MADLDTAVAFEHEILRRSSTTTWDFPWGFATVNATYPQSHSHNQVTVTSATEAGVIIETAEEVLGRAGLRYRNVALDCKESERVASALVSAGYSDSIDLLMALERPTQPAASEVRVQRVPGSVLDSAVQAAWRRARPDMSDEEARQLVARRVLYERASAVSYHAVQLDGAWVSRCECYRLGGTAQIDAVMTDPPYEGRGLGRAVIVHAVEYALAAGAEFVFLRTRDDDWPQHLYRQLGFRDLGTVHALFRALDAAP